MAREFVFFTKKRYDYYFDRHARLTEQILNSQLAHAKLYTQDFLIVLRVETGDELR